MTTVITRRELEVIMAESDSYSIGERATWMESLIHTVSVLYEQLKKLEWSSQTGFIYFCPVCNRLPSSGHSKHCGLGKLLA